MNQAVFLAALVACLAPPFAVPAHAQLDLFSKEQGIEFTPAKSTPNGRPR
jgi:hypothetical protein